MRFTLGCATASTLPTVSEGQQGEKAQFEVESFWVGALRRAVIDGDVDRGSLMAGQSVGLIDDILPMREAVEKLVADARAELGRVAKLVGHPGGQGGGR